MKIRLLAVLLIVFAISANILANNHLTIKSFADEKLFLNETSITFDDPSDTSSIFSAYINHGTLNIKCTSPLSLTNAEIVVYNLLGKEIVRKKLDKTNLNQVALPIQNTCFIIRITYSGKVFTQKVIASKD